MRYLAAIILMLSSGFSFGQKKDDYKPTVDSLLKIKSTDEVILFFKEELNKKPNDEGVLRWIGYLYVMDNQLDQGEKYYREALSRNASCARCYTNLGRIAAMRKDAPKALELLNKSLAIDPADATTYQIRASVKASEKDLTGALEDYSKAVELEPRRADCYIDRANFYVNQQNYTAAVTDLGKAIQLAPEYYLPYYRRATAYFDIRKHNEALRDINVAIRLDSTHAALYAGRAALYSYYNEHGKAFADYSKAISIDPEDYFNYYGRSHERYIMEDMDGFCGDIQECHELIKRKDPKNPLKAELENRMAIYCDPSKASYYYQRGIAGYNLQKFDKAVEVYTLGIRKFSENGMLYSFRGNAFLMQMDFHLALEDYYAAIKYKENVLEEYRINMTVNDSRGISAEDYGRSFVSGIYVSIAQCRLALGQYKDALEAINRGIEMGAHIKDYGLENFYNVRGNIYLAIQDYPAAMKDFNKCIELNPGFSPAFANRAVARINVSGQARFLPSSVWISNLNQTMFMNWTIPAKTKVKKMNPELDAALSDLNKAIDLDKGSPFAYYIRGMLSKMTGQGSSCADLVMAGNLSFPVAKELIEGCRK